MLLDEFFRPPNALRWQKRGEKITKAPVVTQSLDALTQFKAVQTKEKK